MRAPLFPSSLSSFLPLFPRAIVIPFLHVVLVYNCKFIILMLYIMSCKKCNNCMFIYTWQILRLDSIYTFLCLLDSMIIVRFVSFLLFCVWVLWVTCLTGFFFPVDCKGGCGEDWGPCGSWFSEERVLGQDGAVGSGQSLREPGGHVGACVCVCVCVCTHTYVCEDSRWRLRGL